MPTRSWFRRRWISLGVGALVLASGLPAEPASGDGVPEVFTAPAAGYEYTPLSGAPVGEVMRWIGVEERMGRTRRGAPVRVPVFLAGGECHDPTELAIVTWPERVPVAVQADDVRRAADGGVARLHLWFTTDLAAGEVRRWALVRRSAVPAVATPAVLLQRTKTRLRLTADATTVEFVLASRAPALAALRLVGGPALAFRAGAGPRLAIPGRPDFAAEKTTLTCGTGPVFAKVRLVRRAADGLGVVQEYRLFSDGTLNLVQAVTPGVAPLPALGGQFFLAGVAPAEGSEVLPQPAGVVDALADFHSGLAVDAILGRTRGWLVLPGSPGGAAGRVTWSAAGEFKVAAPGGLAASANRRAAWAEVSFVPCATEALRPALLDAAQPLVAVVERPELTLTAAVARITDNVREMKPVGWGNAVATRALEGSANPWPKRKWSVEADPAHWVEAARRARAKVTADGTKPLREDEKGRAAGPLNPYDLTYGVTPLAAWLQRAAVPPAALASLRAQLEATRRQLGRGDEGGWPFLDAFSRAQNMQMGAPLLVLADPGAAPGLRSFARDQLAAPVLAAVLARGWRPYAGRAQSQPEESDTLYQAVVDFMLRATELTAGEPSTLSRLAYGRYLDAVDVTADLYHPAQPRDADDDRHFARANFFRTQSHSHRWLAWGPAPYFALLAAPQPDGPVWGTTEAWYAADMLAGRWKNWPDQSWLYLSAVLPAQAGRVLPARPPAPEVSVEFPADGNKVAWNEVQDAVAYRVYRVRSGQPEWLDSPYRNEAAPPLTGRHWHDADGRKGDRYIVHAVDAGGRESAW